MYSIYQKMPHDLLSKVANPKKYGPYWYLIHKKAFNAKSLPEKEDFVRFVEWVISILLCEECHEHSTKYIKENPIRSFFHVKDERSGAEIGCFKWSWIFHNVVNRRLGKKEIDWITALSMYSSDEKCKDCGHGSKDDKLKDDKLKNSKVKNNDDKNVKVKMVSKYH